MMKYKYTDRELTKDSYNHTHVNYALFNKQYRMYSIANICKKCEYMRGECRNKQNVLDNTRIKTKINDIYVLKY